MTDHELWSEAVGRVKSEYTALSDSIKQRLSGLTSEIRALKDEHQKLMARFSADNPCERCNGICCRYGKHHFTAVELIVYLVSESLLFAPSFEHPVCPYIGGSGCMMAPALRPFNCIIFICEDLDDRLDEASRTGLLAIENRLRQLYQEFDALLGNRFANGLLITFQRALDSGSPIFNCRIME